GNPLLISPELLARDGFLSNAVLESPPGTKRLKDSKGVPYSRVDFREASKWKKKVLEQAVARAGADKRARNALDKFRNDNEWLADFALYCALSEREKKAWFDWPKEVRDRNVPAIKRAARELRERVEFFEFTQYFFFDQWRRLRQHAR